MECFFLKNFFREETPLCLIIKSQPERDGTIFPLERARISVQKFRKGTVSLLEVVFSRWWLVVLSLYLSLPSPHALPCPSDWGIPEPVPEETLPPWHHQRLLAALKGIILWPLELMVCFYVTSVASKGNRAYSASPVPKYFRRGNSPMERFLLKQKPIQKAVPIRNILYSNILLQVARRGRIFIF